MVQTGKPLGAELEAAKYKLEIAQKDLAQFNNQFSQIEQSAKREIDAINAEIRALELAFAKAKAAIEEDATKRIAELDGQIGKTSSELEPLIKIKSDAVEAFTTQTSELFVEAEAAEEKAKEDEATVARLNEDMPIIQSSFAKRFAYAKGRGFFGRIGFAFNGVKQTWDLIKDVSKRIEEQKLIKKTCDKTILETREFLGVDEAIRMEDETSKRLEELTRQKEALLASSKESIVKLTAELGKNKTDLGQRILAIEENARKTRFERFSDSGREALESAVKSAGNAYAAISGAGAIVARNLTKGLKGLREKILGRKPTAPVVEAAAEDIEEASKTKEDGVDQEAKEEQAKKIIKRSLLGRLFGKGKKVKDSETASPKAPEKISLKKELESLEEALGTKIGLYAILEYASLLKKGNQTRIEKYKKEFLETISEGQSRIFRVVSAPRIFKAIAKTAESLNLGNVVFDNHEKGEFPSNLAAKEAELLLGRGNPNSEYLDYLCGFMSGAEIAKSACFATTMKQTDALEVLIGNGALENANSALDPLRISLENGDGDIALDLISKGAKVFYDRAPATRPTIAQLAQGFTKGTGGFDVTGLVSAVQMAELNQIGKDSGSKLVACLQAKREDLTYKLLAEGATATLEQFPTICRLGGLGIFNHLARNGSDIGSPQAIYKIILAEFRKTDPAFPARAGNIREKLFESGHHDLLAKIIEKIP